jgi:hypothetical protein
VNSVFHAALAAIVVCLTPGIDVSAEDRFLEQEPDSYIKLGDIKGEYRSDEYRSDEYRSDPDSYIKLGDIKGEYRSDEYCSDPDSYIKLGDIKGEYKTGTPAERVHAQDWLSELDDLIWEAEADDFFWRDGKRSPSELPDQWIWEEESGDF